MFSTYFHGLALGLSLCVAIGPQNAFVLKQGLKRQHILWICLICTLSDAILIALGVLGFSGLIRSFPDLLNWAKYAGAAFLMFYGWQHFQHMQQGGQALNPEGQSESSLGQIVLICLAFTWLNPHVYLDTVVLIGSVSTQYQTHPMAFAFGAMSASLVFFFALGYGSRYLLPIFQHPRSWQILDGIIALMMWGIAISLLCSASF